MLLIVGMCLLTIKELKVENKLQAIQIRQLEEDNLRLKANLKAYMILKREDVR